MCVPQCLVRFDLMFDRFVEERFLNTLPELEGFYMEDRKLVDS